MGVILSEDFDLDSVSFIDITAFWDIAMLGIISDELGRYPQSEKEYMNHLSEKGRENYIKVKEENPDWTFPGWLNQEVK